MNHLKSAFFRLALILCLLSTWFPTGAVNAAVDPQQRTPEQKAADLLSRMSPAEKVGQLFLITFNGTGVAADSKIYELISKYHIGGVVL
ncbi:MAG: hypothetical protein LWX83_15705, partial [Anaerolineae bacterium]|nr:hypothetical protein [Anaerolineae bacterium]